MLVLIKFCFPTRSWDQKWNYRETCCYHLSTRCSSLIKSVYLIELFKHHLAYQFTQINLNQYLDKQSTARKMCLNEPLNECWIIDASSPTNKFPREKLPEIFLKIDVFNRHTIFTSVSKRRRELERKTFRSDEKIIVFTSAKSWRKTFTLEMK